MTRTEKDVDKITEELKGKKEESAEKEKKDQELKENFDDVGRAKEGLRLHVREMRNELASTTREQIGSHQREALDHGKDVGRLATSWTV